MSRYKMGLFAAAFAWLVVVSCSPYPIYNGSGAPPAPRADLDDDGSDADREPAVESPRARRNQRRAATPTTIDARLFRRIVDTYLGTPYKRGGDNLRGIDCSNLVTAIYRDYDGTELPENTRGLYRLPEAVVDDELQIGDLVFFTFGSSRGPSHVGVYLGDNRFVHASESSGVVISSLDEAIYRDAYRGARRVAPLLHTGE
ncbi:MAG TPA: NlpC/P60 family protein [bacterium]|nr:NlpC/P60 family protein [bacterium]